MGAPFSEVDRELLARVLDLIAGVTAADDVESLAESVLPTLARIGSVPTIVAHLSDARLGRPRSFAHGLDVASADLERACGDWLGRVFEAGDEAAIASWDSAGTSFALHPLAADGRVLGFLATPAAAELPATDLWHRVAAAVARSVDRLAERASTERKILHLNTYLTVSSMLAKSVDLAELLEIALYCSMETVGAEAASILLLDETKETFQFYRVEGVAKPLLGGATFPATEGIAGRVLETREAEIVNDAESDPRFYGQIDERTGYRTRNLMAIPLIAGDEPVGVLEVLNKEGGGPFTADERMILVSVADEIAFAVRNATVFDYVVNTYCKRRQGQSSCKGCERPLGSWTPCMRYREFLP